MSNLLVNIYQPTPNNGRCQLRAYRPRESAVVAIFTELADNTGMSVTNAIEQLATDIRRGQMRQGEVLVVIEHHPFDGQIHLDIEGEYSFVQMTWDAERQRYHSPRWEYVKKERVEAMIGESL